MDVTIAAVIPTAGARPELLRDALFSVLEQRRPADEIVLVVDGPEPVLERVRTQVMTITPNARIVGTAGLPHGGVAAARNLGARTSKSSWLAFLDDDDLWTPAHLLRWQSYAQSADLYLAAFQKLRLDGTVVVEKWPPAVLHPRSFLVTNPGLRGSNLAISASLYATVGGFDEALPALNDLDLGVRLAGQTGVRYVRSMEPTVVFRSHSGSRLTSRSGSAIQTGVERFWAKHGGAMNKMERGRFRERAMKLWGISMGGEE